MLVIQAYIVSLHAYERCCSAILSELCTMYKLPIQLYDHLKHFHTFKVMCLCVFSHNPLKTNQTQLMDDFVTCIIGLVMSLISHMCSTSHQLNLQVGWQSSQDLSCSGSLDLNNHTKYFFSYHLSISLQRDKGPILINSVGLQKVKT